jgi:hypothetical protein
LGRYLGVYSELSPANLVALFHEYGPEIAWELALTSRSDVIDNTSDIFTAVLSFALQGGRSAMNRGWHPDTLPFLFGVAEMVNPSKYDLVDPSRPSEVTFRKRVSPDRPLWAQYRFAVFSFSFVYRGGSN